MHEIRGVLGLSNDRWIREGKTCFFGKRQRQAEITALQILYSRPYKQRLTEPMLKELEKKRREVWNPGTLSPSLTLQQLREPHGAFPANPLLAEPLYLAKFAHSRSAPKRALSKSDRHG